ncbi:DUF3800 domain-containing protein [Dermacoccus barathri]
MSPITFSDWCEMPESSLNIYCDESSHLPNDGMPVMVLGAITCESTLARQSMQRLFDIRKRHAMPHDFEIKWTKVSPAKVGFYLDVVDYFFDSTHLNFRTVVAPKGKLDHSEFNQTHDDWYYKMMFYLVRNVLPASGSVHIYLDKKDTRGGVKARKLHDVTANAAYDFDRSRIRRVQIVESHHVGLLQLADLLLGAVNYANRGMSTSAAKSQVVQRIRERSGYELTRSTLPTERKFNVFVWRPQGGRL